MVGWSKVLERYVELGRRLRKRCNSYPKGQQAKGKGHPERFVSGLRCHAGWFYSFWIWWCIIINLLGHGVEAAGQCHGDPRGGKEVSDGRGRLPHCLVVVALVLPVMARFTLRSSRNIRGLFATRFGYSLKRI